MKKARIFYVLLTLIVFVSCNKRETAIEILHKTIKFAKNTPLIMQESMQVGQQWGMKIGQDFEKKMKEKGY